MTGRKIVRKQERSLQEIGPCIADSLIRILNVVYQQKNKDDLDKISKVIIAYWKDNPEAQDTIEGIAQWWLSERVQPFAIEDIKIVLKELVGQKKVVTHQLKDGTILYSLK